MRTLLASITGIALSVALSGGVLAEEPETVSAWVKKHGGQFTHHTSNNGGPGYEIVLPKSTREEDLNAFVALKPTKTWSLNLLPCVNLPQGAPRLLKDMPALELLELSVADNDDLKYIAETFPRLRWLSLRKTKVTDAGLKHLVAMKKLEKVYLNAAYVTDACWKELAAVKSLEFVSLHGTAVTGEGIKQLATVKSLRAIDLGQTKVTDDIAEELSQLNGLRELNLRDRPITNKTVKAISGLTELRELNLAYTAVTDAAVEDLTMLTNLEVINVDGAKLTKSGIDKLKKALPNCRVLQ